MIFLLKACILPDDPDSSVSTAEGPSRNTIGGIAGAVVVTIVVITVVVITFIIIVIAHQRFVNMTNTRKICLCVHACMHKHACMMDGWMY